MRAITKTNIFVVQVATDWLTSMSKHIYTKSMVFMKSLLSLRWDHIKKKITILVNFPLSSVVSIKAQLTLKSLSN